ncbi:hypothetical protein SDC9_209698 [bioreactor metagenome]|uniref:Uncharacterized protein n=1 Tax=bioreactor metagenome TaxID=1076179 RepID=A0A645JFH8_9ZZZZ
MKFPLPTSMAKRNTVIMRVKRGRKSLAKRRKSVPMPSFLVPSRKNASRGRAGKTAVRTKLETNTSRSIPIASNRKRDNIISTMTAQKSRNVSNAASQRSCRCCGQVFLGLRGERRSRHKSGRCRALSAKLWLVGLMRRMTEKKR